MCAGITLSSHIHKIRIVVVASLAFYCKKQITIKLLLRKTTRGTAINPVLDTLCFVCSNLGCISPPTLLPLPYINNPFVLNPFPAK